MIVLTAGQKRAYEFISTYIKENEISPSHAEIAEGLGIKSRGGTHRYVEGLVKAGYVKLIPGRQRNIQIVESFDNNSQVIPFEGRIAAGMPIEAIADKQSLDLNEEFFSDDRYALEVMGDSMIDVGILDGDTVLIKSQQTAKDKDIVVALIDKEEDTLKRFYRVKNNKVILVPENVEMKPMEYSADRVDIQGVLVAQFRKYS